MFNDLPPELRNEEVERNAYNAAFYELGLRWHWDGAIWGELQTLAAQPRARIRHYLQTRQPHLLTAYDADFLAEAIESRVEQQKLRGATPCDWSRLLGGEIGV